MKLGTSKYYICKQQGTTNSFSSNLNPSKKWNTNPTVEENANWSYLYNVFKDKSKSDEEKMTELNTYCEAIGINSKTTSMKSKPQETITTITYDPEFVETAIQNLMNFFSEFDFEPNFRFINTFAYATSKSINESRSYITNYFKLIDSPDINSIVDKMKSDEFITLSAQFANLTPNKKINNRFKIYYGAAGTGKTTKAIQEANGNCMVCHSAMLPSDLMEDFKFENGKATFIPSALQNAMENGTIIVLDEINLLPFESLRFLQTILDGKKQFEYKGKTVHINDGFKIIGTMNLKVNGSTFCLPDPLVDRAEELKEFKLKAKDLVGAII